MTVSSEALWGRVGYAARPNASGRKTIHLLEAAGREYFRTSCGLSYPLRDVADPEVLDQRCKTCENKANNE